CTTTTGSTKPGCTSKATFTRHSLYENPRAVRQATPVLGGVGNYARALLLRLF
ncbi:MAG: hypothetical protein ACI944_000539, partial [Natronomonas sp.]